MRDLSNTLVSSALCFLSLSTCATSLALPGLSGDRTIQWPTLAIRGLSKVPSLVPEHTWRINNQTGHLGNVTSGSNSTQPRRERLCTKPRIRREWRRLSNDEKLDYLRAVQCMHDMPGKHLDVWPNAMSHYDDFVALHITTTNGTTPIHNNGLFLPWHRRLVWLWETALINDCGYKGAQPFWDYYLDGPAYDRHFNMSPVWDVKYGFGGNGYINQTLANQNQPANPWGDGPVHTPGFNPWGDEPVHPPKSPSEAAQSEKPSGPHANEDTWGAGPVHPPSAGAAVAPAASAASSASSASAAPPAPAQPETVASQASDAAPVAAASPAAASTGNSTLGAPILEDGEEPSDEGWTRRDLTPARRYTNMKRQAITAQNGAPGSGHTTLSRGGPAWPFIGFLPLIPPFLLDGLLRPDDDNDIDDPSASGPDTSAAPDASNDNPSVVSQRPKPGAWGCVQDGPFANWTVNYGPGESLEKNPRCLQRGWTFDIAERALTAERMEEVMSKPSYAKFMELDFETNLNMGPHTVGHRGIGGDMYNLYSSTNDPIFFLHHGFIDRLWTLWQGRNSSRLWDADANYDGLPPPRPGVHPPTGRTTLDSPLNYGVMAPNTKISAVMDTLNREEDEENVMCYTYDDAVWPGDY